MTIESQVSISRDEIDALLLNYINEKLPAPPLHYWHVKNVFMEYAMLQLKKRDELTDEDLLEKQAAAEREFHSESVAASQGER